jgi:hypothetical protein
MDTIATTREYTHQELRTDYTGLAGYYCPYKEVKLDYHGRQVLYVVGHAAIESSCCGISNWDYVLVPGYVVDWQKSANQNGLAMTTVEPVQDAAARAELSGLIKSAENTDRINFW